MSVLIFSLLAVVSAVGAPPSSDQTPAGNPMRINACTLLTRDVVDKVKVAKTVVNIPPEEKPAGAKGSYCDYGGIGLQIDPFAGADQIRKSPQKNWVPVSGVGDTAYFHNVRRFLCGIDCVERLSSLRDSDGGAGWRHRGAAQAEYDSAGQPDHSEIEVRA